MLKRRRILVADDSDDNRALCAELLAFYGFQVVTAADGQEAIAQARQLRPDLILLDLAMPILSGWEAARQLRADPTLRGVPLIALTAHAFPEPLQQARDAGFDLVLTKPCDLADLRAAVESLLGDAPAPDKGAGSEL